MDQPAVAGAIAGGLALLVAFVMIERRVDQPMVDVGCSGPPPGIAGLMSSVGRGGLQFMLIIWLQGIWLPLHGYSFESTPLWRASTCCP